jgi:predicted alpha/beta hydrolase family esterase
MIAPTSPISLWKIHRSFVIPLFAFFLGAAFFAPQGYSQQTVLDTWQSYKDSIRPALTPLRQPNYDCILLARTIKDDAGKPKPEELRLDGLPKRLVLVVGGLQTSCEASKAFATQLEQELGMPADLRVGAFDYPNDGSIAESGQALLVVLKLLSEKSPNTRLTLVTHSMGGLVARTALERNAKDRINVDQLIMICPPNQGSVLAQYADALELADAVSRVKESRQDLRSLPTLLIDDGLGEACEELIPNSHFLTELNRCARVPGVKYSIIAGSKGPINPIARLVSSLVVEEVDRHSRDRFRDSALLDEAIKRTNELLQSDELTKGLGDGAVSLKSAKLDGVTDFETLKIKHTEWCHFDRPEVQDLLRHVAVRIAEQTRE